MSVPADRTELPPPAQAAINPYAPTAEVGEPNALPDLPHASAVVVVLNTIGGVTFSGGIFGVGMVLSSRDLIGEMALLAFVVGTILAFCGAVAIVPLVLAGRVFLTPGGRDFNSRQIYRFGAICGGLTGFLCLVIPSGFAPLAMAFALIPALVGTIFTVLLLIPLARRVQQREQSFEQAMVHSSGDFGFGASDSLG